MRFADTLSMAIRYLYATAALFMLSAALQGCGGGTPALPVTPRNISGVYDGVVANFDGRGDARVGFSFDERGGALVGAVRIGPHIASSWKMHHYKTMHTVDSYRADASGTHVSGHANFGGDIGTFAFRGTIAGGTFTYTYKDAVGSGGGSATWAGPFVEPGSTVAVAQALAAVRRMAYSGSYTVNLGTVNVLDSFTQAPCAPLNPGGLTSVPMTISLAQPDGYGGIALTGQFGGPLGYVGGTGPYPFSDDEANGQAAEIFGFWTSIDQTYVPANPAGIYELEINIGGWSPPQTDTYGSWEISDNDAAGICQGAGSLTSVTSP